MSDGISRGASGLGKYAGLIVCSCFLFVAAFSRWPYFFYIVLRFLVCAVSIYYGLAIFREGRSNYWVWVFGAIGVLFNPLLPLRMARSDWKVLNLLVGAFFIVWFVMSSLRNGKITREESSNLGASGMPQSAPIIDSRHGSQHTLDLASESEPEAEDTTPSQAAELWFQTGRNFYDLADIREIDEEKAIECFEEGLRLMPSHTGLHVYLGMIYQDGGGVPKDLAKAFEHFSVAAGLGNRDGQRCLGELYESGDAISVDHTKAVYWYRKAAEQQDSYAQYRLGFHYFSGLGIPQDRDQAFLWYSKASDNGNSDAQRALRELAT